MGKKEAHESFVQNLAGSSSREVFLFISCIAVFTLLDGLVRCLLHLRDSEWQNKPFLNYCQVSFIVDLTVLTLPMLFIATIFSEYLLAVLIASLISACSLLLYIITSIDNESPEKDSAKDGKRAVAEVSSVNQSSEDRHNISAERVIVSEYRGTILFFTTITILAVDFSIFPRWMAKTETAGYSVMDMGVGAFVIANALVAPQAKETERSSLRMLWKEVQDSAILMLLGCGRFVSVTLTDYQAPEAEYGKHWNFFCTLAVIKILARLSALVLPPRYLPFLGLGLTTLYEGLLQSGWYEIALSSSDHRRKLNPFLSVGLISDNLSGLSSCLGFLSLFLIWTFFGRECLKRRKLEDLLVYGVQLALASFAVMLALDLFPLPSRRLANASYVLWTTHLALAFLSMLTVFRIVLMSVQSFTEKTHHGGVQSCVMSFRAFLTGDEVMPPADSLSPRILSAVNYNAMAIFLGSNILTGLINLSTDTMQYRDLASFILLLLYVIIVSGLASMLHYHNLKVLLRLPGFLFPK